VRTCRDAPVYIEKAGSCTKSEAGHPTRPHINTSLAPIAQQCGNAVVCSVHTHLACEPGHQQQLQSCAYCLPSSPQHTPAAQQRIPQMTATHHSFQAMRSGHHHWCCDSSPQLRQPPNIRTPLPGHVLIQRACNSCTGVQNTVCSLRTPQGCNSLPQPAEHAVDTLQSELYQQPKAHTH
jgi:hypothetical protein